MPLRPTLYEWKPAWGEGEVNLRCRPGDYGYPPPEALELECLFRFIPSWTEMAWPLKYQIILSLDVGYSGKGVTVGEVALCSLGNP